MAQLNEIQLSYEPKINYNFQLNNPFDVANYLREIISNNYISEEAIVIFLNQNSNIIGHKHLSVGDLTKVIIDIKLICTMALLTRCAKVILCHSHPSGNKNVSDQDIAITKQVQEALKLFEIKLLDHIILTSGDYVSMAQTTKLF